MSSAQNTTELLLTLREGDGTALDRLMPRLYDELRRIAHRQLAQSGGKASLRTTGLVHEAYLKLVDQARVEVEDRAHFLALAAKTMRHVIIDDARRRGAKKRGGEWRRISLDHVGATAPERELDVITLDGALTRLEAFDERLCKVVECRFFGGLTVKETATALRMSPRSVDRAWQKARAWLYREMNEA
jgi:RNA polymerase sigma factor (TIGR02999 family)